MRHLETRAMRISTEDQAQVRELDILVLDLDIPGGREYSLGFCSELKRKFVVLSRAKIRMLIFGDKDMGDIRFPTIGSRIGKDLINKHIQDGALWIQTMPDTTAVLNSLET